MLAGPDKFSRQSKYFLARGTVGKRREQGIQNESRKRTRKSRVAPFAIATPRCQQNFLLPAKLPLLLSSPPRRAGQRAPDSRGYRRSPSPCLLQCSLPAPPPSVPLPRVHPGPQPRTASETPQTPFHRSEPRQRFPGVRSALFVGAEIHTGVG